MSIRPRSWRFSRIARLSRVVLCVLALPSVGWSQDAPSGAARRGRPLVIEDFYRLRTVANPRLSPDGRLVAYTVTSRVEATNAEPGEVWLASTTGDPSPRRVSPEGLDASAPSWSSDGKLEFRGDRKAWRYDPSTGAPAVETGNAANGRNAERRLAAPNGSQVAILRDVAPPAPSPDTGTEFERRHAGRFKGVQFDWLDFQRDGQPFPVPDRTNPAVTPAQEIWLEQGGSARQLTRLGLRPQGLEWNADGTLLLFTADSAYRDDRRYGASAVYVVATDGSVRTLTPNRDYRHSDARFSPDGRWVLYTRQLSTDAVIRDRLNHGGATDLVVAPVEGGGERVLTSSWDYLPGNATWSADSRTIYFMGGVGGTTHLFRVRVTGGPVEQVTKGERRINGVTFDKSFTKIAYTVGQIEAPAELHVASIDGMGERRLTNVNGAVVSEIGLSRAEQLQFASADGTPIEGWLMYPHGYRPEAGPYPLVVSSHGGPHAADGYAFDFKSQYLAANGYFVLKVNFRSSTGYGEKFLWATWGAWGTKDGQDVMAGVDHAISRYPIDRARVATIGHSYGGFMTNWLITQYPDRFAAAVPGAGIVNWVSDYGTADVARTKETEFYGTPWDSTAREIMIRQSPLTYAHRVKAPTLFVHGEIDQRVPYSEAEQMYVALKKNGVPAKMIQYQGMAHGIIGSWNQVHRMLNERAWLDRWLKGGPGVS